MGTRKIWIVPVVLMLAAALSLPGCGGGGGDGGGVSGGTVQTVTVRGTVGVDNSSGTVVLGRTRPMLAPGAVPLDNALVKAFDYATGLEYKFVPPDYPSPPRTGADGSYSVKLPKGRDFILFFERLLTSGKTARFSAPAANMYDNQLIEASDNTSIVAQALAAMMGQSRDLSEASIDNVTDALAAILSNPGYANLARLTVGENNALVGNSYNTGLLPVDNTIRDAQDGVEALIGTLPSPPARPAGVSVSAGDAANTIAWTAVDNASSYNVYSGTDNSVTRAPANLLATTTSTSYPHGALTNGQRYYYVVTAVNAGGESAESEMVSGMPLAVPGAPATVTAMGGNRQVTLSWDVVAGSTSYNIYWSTTAGVSKASAKIAGRTTTGYVHGGLSAWTTYYYRVTAVNANGAEGNLSAEVSAGTDDGTHVATLAEAKAMTADLRDTAQSLINYRERGVTASNGVIDNAATNLKAEIDNVIVPYFQSFGTSMGSFLAPSFEALGAYPLGGDFVSNTTDGGLAYIGPRADGEWRIHTFNGLDVRLYKASAGSLLLTPVNFDVTSAYDNSLRYNGTFSNVVVNSTWQLVTSAAISGSFSNSTSGTGTSQRINVSGNLSATVDGSGDITAFSVTGNFSSPYLTGSGTLSFAGRIVRAEYYGPLNDNPPGDLTSSASRVEFSNGSLATRKGTFTGSFRFDLAASGLKQEEYDINDGGFNFTNLRLMWDERGGGKRLADLEIGWDGPVFGYGRGWLTDPPTGSGDSWTITLHGWYPGEYTRYTVTVNRANPAAPTISGTIQKHLWYGVFQDSTTSFSGSRSSRMSFFPYPTYVNFFGRYVNADTSVPFNSIEGTITATFLNAASSDPYFFNTYDVITAANFPQVRVQFNGTVSTTARPSITGAIDAQSSYSSAGTAGNPNAGFAYMKIAGTTNYQDGIESISGTGTVYTRLVPDTQDTAKRDFEFEQAVLSLKNARNVSFDLQWNRNVDTEVSSLTGEVYFTPPSPGAKVTFGTVSEVLGVPRITWIDDSFESLP